MELSADGSYNWWAPYLQSDLAAKSMLQTGKWVLNGRNLSLHVDKAFLGHLSPGTVWTLEIKSASPEKIILTTLPDRRENEWTRLSERDEPFWKRAVSYLPPFAMHSRLDAPTGDTQIGDWHLYSTYEAGKDARAEVVFHLESLAQFLGPERAAQPIRTVTDLKTFLDSRLAAGPAGGNFLSSLTKVDGRESLTFTSGPNRIQREQPKWRCGVCFFWQRHATEEKITLCLITMEAETPETLRLLTNSLATVKLIGVK